MSPVYIYILILTLVLCIFGYILLKLKAKKSTPTFNYSKKKFLRDDEFVFYQLLLQLFASDYLVFAQVRLGDIIEYKGFEYTPKNKIYKKSVDFLLVNKMNRNIYIVVELDGDSHLNQDRKDRDTFVDEALRSAGVPVYHQIKKQSYDNLAEIKTLILNTLNSNSIK